TLVNRVPAVEFDLSSVASVSANRLPRTDGERVARRHAAELGEAALSAGEVAVGLVAGGQGARLAFDGPQGAYPNGPVSTASLFQIHAEKVLARGKRHGRTIPFYVMTSPENHEATVAYFAQNDRFGLKHLRFFTQGQMPAVDRRTGRILLSSKG